MILLLCTLAAAKDVQVQIQGLGDPALPQGLSVDLQVGLTARGGVGPDLRVTSLGGLGPSWLYLQGNASLALCGAGLGVESSSRPSF